ncbi:hypothetical protein [Paraburkholderia atlantica]|uniref:Transmembrane protein n=1 Tax=Paraburkholderia atlantica TaxID=2654982 RepID=D5WNH7_PARAM|nr:hypothetical protein [Paraburkholderia atlantica]ADG20856.1 hypothetical protein BC1002_7106 [Paraburkholderia atlantica]MBB5510930.1 hypothetical protein [Paraburkholderia atlantica]
MSDTPKTKEPQGSGDPSTDRTSSTQLSVDVDRCERLVAHAARIGVPVRDADIDAIRSARRSLETGVMSAPIRSALHAAMNRIACAVQYPDPRIVEDLDRCGDLVSHAAQMGKPLSESDIACLSVARAARQELAWNAMTEAIFYAGMSRIARAVAPIIAETASAQARKGARLAIKAYTWASFGLAFLVVSLSCLLFVVNQISADVSKVVEQNDAAALSMHNLLQAHRASIIAAKDGGEDALLQLQNSQLALQIKQLLQQFATNNRQLYADVKRTEAIRQFFFIGEADSPYKPKCIATGASADKRSGGINVNLGRTPIAASKAGNKADPTTADWNCDPDSRRRALEVDLPLLATDSSKEAGSTKPERAWRPEDVVEQGFQKIAVYQDIRAMATNDRDVILAFVGAITSFLLPVLYAWLGACAAILRQLNADTSASLFHPEHSVVANRAHITTAVIVGISIGLFSKLLDQGIEFSPLAVAFVGGYASDKFFAFVDRLVSAIFPARVHVRGESAACVAPKRQQTRMDTAKAPQ